MNDICPFIGLKACVLKEEQRKKYFISLVKKKVGKKSFHPHDRAKFYIHY